MANCKSRYRIATVFGFLFRTLTSSPVIFTQQVRFTLNKDVDDSFLFKIKVKVYQKMYFL
jgi:hypothetical protein